VIEHKTVRKVQVNGDFVRGQDPTPVVNTLLRIVRSNRNIVRLHLDSDYDLTREHFAVLEDSIYDIDEQAEENHLHGAQQLFRHNPKLAAKAIWSIRRIRFCSICRRRGLIFRFLKENVVKLIELRQGERKRKRLEA